MHHTRPRSLALSLLCLLPVLAAQSCVNVDPETNEIIPRGNQALEFKEVKRGAEDLKVGMTKMDVVTLIGSPAEKGTRGDVWIYLPERPAVLVPSRALRLEFKNGRLAEYGYHAIVLGTRF